jgi:transcriptional regulator with XRE-family HTH domain
MQYNIALKRAIIKRGMTQDELAKKTNLPGAHISQLINGKRSVTLQKQDRIAEVLGCSVQELFGARNLT